MSDLSWWRLEVAAIVGGCLVVALRVARTAVRRERRRWEREMRRRMGYRG